METESKRDVRSRLLKRREELTPEERLEKSLLICRRIERYEPFVSAEHILCYVNYKSEVETTRLIRLALRLGKRVYCPLVEGADMEFYEILSPEELRRGFHGILEPPARPRMRYEPRMPRSLMIMPGAAFDRSCHRIGYGGGYYDRYLERAGGVPTVAVAFACQLEASVPHERHDVCPDAIATEDGIIVRGTGRNA